MKPGANLGRSSLIPHPAGWVHIVRDGITSWMGQTHQPLGISLLEPPLDPLIRLFLRCSPL